MAKRLTATGPVEGPWALPEGWRWERLSSLLSEFVAGKRPKGGVAGIIEGSLSIGGEHLRWDGSVSSDNPRYIPHAFANTIPAAKIAANDILVVKDGATTGKTAYARPGLEDMFVNEHVFIVRVDPTVAEARYVFLWLWSQPGFGQIMKDFRGAAQGGIGRTMPDVVSVPLPPLEDQRHIVARVEELFTEIDDGEAALARARENLATWRKALLKAAVTGELTADWRAANPAADTGADLFARIVDERRLRGVAQRIEQDEKDCMTVDVTNGRSSLPEGWTWARIGDLFDVFVGATPSRTDNSLWNGDVPWVSSGEVGFCRISDTREKINRAALRGSAGRLHPPGTVMLGMIGEGRTRGQAAILDIEAAHNQNCASIRVSETSIPPEYIYLVLAEQYERTRRSSSGGNQPALNKERVKAICIPLPGATECRTIAAIYDEASEAIDALEAERVLIGDSVATLRQSVLAAAFRGELA